MTSAQEWHEAAQHLVRDHGADPGEFTRYAPSLGEIAAEHEGVHRYPASFPPVTHQHSGHPAVSDPCYAPFAPAPGGPRGDFAAWPFPNPAVPGEVEWYQACQRRGAADRQAEPEAGR